MASNHNTTKHNLKNSLCDSIDKAWQRMLEIAREDYSNGLFGLMNEWVFDLADNDNADLESYELHYLDNGNAIDAESWVDSNEVCGFDWQDLYNDIMFMEKSSIEMRWAHEFSVYNFLCDQFVTEFR